MDTKLFHLWYNLLTVVQYISVREFYIDWEIKYLYFLNQHPRNAFIWKSWANFSGAPWTMFANLKFQVLTTGNVKMTVFCDVLYSLAEIGQCFVGAYCLHYQVLIIEAVNTSETSVSFYQTHMEQYTTRQAIFRFVKLFIPVLSWIVSNVFIDTSLHLVRCTAAGWMVCTSYIILR
jgi:hypothetical protein